MNPSPLRYPGGKYKMYEYVAQLIQKNNCNTYIEPFCGGAAVALELLFDGVVKKIIINDYDYTIYCFWDSVLHRTDEFIKMVLQVEVSMEEWYKQKAIREDLDSYNSLEIGFSTFFLNRTNRSGIIDKAGPIGGFAQQGDYPIDCRFNKERLVAQIKKIGEKRDSIEVYNLEALDFIDDVISKTRKSFIFFDPPYYGKGPGLYTNAGNSDSEKTDTSKTDDEETEGENKDSSRTSNASSGGSKNLPYFFQGIDYSKLNPNDADSHGVSAVCRELQLFSDKKMVTTYPLASAFLMRSIIEQSIKYYSKKHMIQGQTKYIWENIKSIDQLSKIIKNYNKNLPNYIVDGVM